MGIIFKYHLLLMALIAFGYSLIDFKRGLPALVDTNAQRAELLAMPPRKGLPVAMGLWSRGSTSRALALFGAPVWSALHTFLRSHQFSVGLVPLRSFCFAAALRGARHRPAPGRKGRFPGSG